MTLAELQELQRLLEKAQAHAEQQAAYTPNELLARIVWGDLELSCIEAIYHTDRVIKIISEALYYDS